MIGLEKWWNEKLFFIGNDDKVKYRYGDYKLRVKV